jgi:uncharacterized membrane protein YhhN
MLPFALLTAIALAVLLWGEQRQSPAVKWIAKPLASAGFLGVALAAGALDGTYGRLVLGALALCWLGDVLLIPKGSDPAFKGGLVSFLLGHVVLLAAFAWRGLDATGAALAAVVCGVAVVGVLRWLRPHVPDSFRIPVHAYVAVISLMVVFAAGATAAGAGVALLLGALLFYVSDLAVARERFVARSFLNRAWGLPLYYAATLVLASTAGAA